MIIGFDVRWMDDNLRKGNAFPGGVEQYVYRLLSALVNYTDLKIVAITGAASGNIFSSLSNADNFSEVRLSPPGYLSEIIETEKIDLIHAPIPAFFRITSSVPMITTLHDLQHLYYPQFFSKENIERREFFYKYSALFAERVIVSFKHVKEDIVNFYGIDPAKIDVCPLGAVVPKNVDNSKFSKIRGKYNIPEKYLFYSASMWKHKNHAGLIEALKVLRDKHGIKITLVCTGKKFKEVYSDLIASIKKYNLNQFIRFTGYIPEDDVILLLKNATIAVIPTFYEAGSFPLMEAMSYRVPVLCSDVTSLPETIGDARFIFDPNDSGMIAAKIAMMLKDENLLNESRRNSEIRSNELGWDKAAINFKRTYERALSDYKNNTDLMRLKNKMHVYEMLTNRYLDEKNLILNSMSWKMTAPLRKMIDLIKGNQS